MIEDLAAHRDGARFTAEVCVIGAGAAGITIARELAGAGRSVCLVEGGGLEFEQASQDLYRGSSVGAPIALDGGRLRYFGGTTNHWGGRCAPLDPMDFRRRDWVPLSGWPIRREDLDPYYERARAVTGFPAAWHADDRTLRDLGVTLPAFDPDLVRPFVWHYAPPTPGAPSWSFGTAYRDALRDARNVRVLLHANLRALRRAPGHGGVHDITVATLTGVSATVVAKHYVLCCGGIENARQLLLAAEHNGGGFGNDHGLVGRYFIQHSRAPAAQLASADPLDLLQEQFNILRGTDGLEIEVGLALSPQVQERERLLNCSVVLQYEGDPRSGVAAAQEVWRSLLDGHWAPAMGEKVGRMALDLDALWRSVRLRLATGRHLPSGGSGGVPSRSAVLLLDIEQAPDPDSRISLADERDALGLRQVKVDWRLGELERRTALAFTRYLAAGFATAQIGRCRLEPWLQDTGMALADAARETYHYVGTTRMADDPREGVVDRHCAVHGMGNLHIAGGSVFPTAGHANPTLTIVALALRLADRLKQA